MYERFHDPRMHRIEITTRLAQLDASQFNLADRERFADEMVERNAAGLGQLSDVLARTVEALPEHEAWLKARGMWSGQD